MKFWIDTEFNEHGGELISLALVPEDGPNFYEVLPCPNPGSWVKEHVMPILGREPLASQAELSAALRTYLKQFRSVHIIADWPEDIRFFCQCLIIGPGQKIGTPPITFELDESLPGTADISISPHNALYDALSLRLSAVGK